MADVPAKRQARHQQERVQNLERRVRLPQGRRLRAPLTMTARRVRRNEVPSQRPRAPRPHRLWMRSCAHVLRGSYFTIKRFFNADR